MGRLFLMKKIDENGNVWYSITVPAMDGLKNELFSLWRLRQWRSGLKGFHICFRNAKTKKSASALFFALQELLRFAFQRGGQFQ